MPKNITSVKWSSTALPNGLSLDSATGTVSGTPNVQPGSYSANVSVTTNYGSDSKPISVNIAVPDSWKPVIEQNQVILITADEPMTPYSVTGLNVR